MDKNTILKTINKINKLGNITFQWSKPIIDDKYLNKKKYIYDVKGYGIYDSKAENRFCLLIELPNNKNKKGVLSTLLVNPANTFPADIVKKKNLKSRFDQTIRNLIVLANAIGYSQIIVINTFPYIESNSKVANEYYKKNKSNNEFFKLNFELVEKILNSSNEILVACGDSIDSNLYSDYFEIIKKIKKNNINTKLFTYAKQDTQDCKALVNGKPRHLNLQAANNRKQYNKALADKKLCELDIIDNCFQLK
ncbi:DUF1643 domain-containing protein [bacterium]|nr:DUF1643 domain-containing protein [bacterium]